MRNYTYIYTGLRIVLLGGVLVTTVGSLTGCGKKGPLYIADDAAAKQTTEKDRPEKKKQAVDVQQK